jgi:alpha-amylase
MEKLCMGFEVHQPYRLNPGFKPDDCTDVKNREDIYFSVRNREILARIAERCYIPATQIVLNALDRGFRCSFGFSGTVVEQLERWSPDAYELFRQVARHPNVEVIAQTYYHSLASLFPDQDEFNAQVKLHRKLMKDWLGVRPAVLENTELLFNNEIARSASAMGYKAIYAEGTEEVLGQRSPNHVYTCNGIRLLMRNSRLSDDIALRFNDRGWDRYPLTADRYAGWIAASPGECVNVLVNYETFGEHYTHDTGIFEFLKWLPDECRGRGIEFSTPSEIAEIEPAEELFVPGITSRAEPYKDDTAWRGNTLQRKAFEALQNARPFIKDKNTWRRLQASDHFFCMSSMFGSCAESHSFFSEGECRPYDAFRRYMAVLADLESRDLSKMKRKTAARVLRNLAPRDAFRFFNPEVYTGFEAFSLDDFAKLLNFAPADSVDYHLKRKDFTGWIEGVLGDAGLAADVNRCSGRIELCEVVDQHRKLLRAEIDSCRHRETGGYRARGVQAPRERNRQRMAEGLMMPECSSGVIS